MEKRKEKEENVGTVALDSSLELSGIMLAEEEFHGAANWSDIVEEKGEETQPGFFVREGFKEVTLAVIEKRILNVVKEGRPLIIGGDWNARVGKEWNGRGESTYNTRGKVLVESFKRLALLLPQLEEEAPVFTWRAGKRKSIVDYVVA